MKILVTGGGGFLGRYIVEGLLEKGHTVSTFARSPQDELEKMGVSVVQGDLQNAEAVRLATIGMDAVFHVAAKAGISGSAFAVNIFIVYRTTAPPITGTDSSSENRAAESLSRPSCRAIVIVTPLRDAPGIRAATWATPIKIACL